MAVQLLTGPVKIFTAAVDTARPDTDDLSHTFTEIGQSSESEGVTISWDNQVTMERVSSEPLPVKELLTQSGITVSWSFKDFQPSTLASIGGQSSTSQAKSATAVAWTKIPLIPKTTNNYAILLRGRSPADYTFEAEFYLPKASLRLTGSVVLTRSAAALLPCVATVLKSENSPHYLIKTANAS